MRTSQDTASCHRAETYINHLISINQREIEHLTRQQSSLIKEIKALTSEYKSAAKIEEAAVNSEKEALAAHKGSRDTWNMFKNQAQHFFSTGKCMFMPILKTDFVSASFYVPIFSDGSSTITIASDNKSKLLEAMKNYKEDYENTKNDVFGSKQSLESARAVAVTKRIEVEMLKEQAVNNEKKLKALKRESSPLKVLKSTDKITGGRVESIITTIHNVAEKRRSIVNE